MKYVLLFVETEEFAAELQAMSPDARERAYELVGKWFADNAPKIQNSSKLQPEHTATTVRRTGGDHVISDGPFVEGKEVISGICEVEVADLDEAVAMAKSWPGCPVVEIRPIEA